MTILLFEMITHVPRQHLGYLLSLIEDMVRNSTNNLQLCRLLFHIISKNFDYTRKETCIKWYLELCAKLGVYKNAKL